MRVVALASAAVTCALAAAPVSVGAGSSAATPSKLAAVSVVGSGFLNWTVEVRSKPSRSAPTVKTLTVFRPDYRPRAVLALSELDDPVTGKPAWYQITVPGRPNGRTGWIPATAAALKPVDRWLVVYRGSRKFEFYVKGKLRRTGPVAIGRPGMETPVGLFYVQAKYDPTWAVLGAYAFETSGYSKLSEWPGGGVVGVHGTNTPQFIGQAVSHGCVRLLNKDVEYLRSVVTVGTPVKIVAA